MPCCCLWSWLLSHCRRQRRVDDAWSSSYPITWYVKCPCQCVAALCVGSDQCNGSAADDAPAGTVSKNDINGFYYPLDELDCDALVSRYELGGTQVCYNPPLIRPNDHLRMWLGDFSLGNSSTSLPWLHAVANATSQYEGVFGEPLFSNALYQDIAAHPSEEYSCALGITPKISFNLSLATGSAESMVGRTMDGSSDDWNRQYVTFNITALQRQKVFAGNQ